jgi:hypothetical protein
LDQVLFQGVHPLVQACLHLAINPDYALTNFDR